RECACGGAAAMSDDCHECSEKRLSVQRKVSRPGDELELVYKASFVEFVNVQVGGGGWSKQSSDFQWHSITWLEKAGGPGREKSRRKRNRNRRHDGRYRQPIGI